MSKEQKNNPLNMDTLTDTIRTMIASKAESQKVEEVVQNKANKLDTEMCMRWVDLLHKMVH